MHTQGHHEACHKLVNVVYNSVTVATTISSQLVWDVKYYPYYYIPARDFLAGVLTKLDGATPDAAKLTVKNKSTNNVKWVREGELKDYAKLPAEEMDSWFEEAVEIYGSHPKDPYSRIETLPSSRHIVVKIDGVTVAETSSPTLLFETGLPTRYYMPKTSILFAGEGLEFNHTETTSVCPYKGSANYYSVTVNGKVHEDVIWWYKYPTAESVLVAGLVCFYNEKVTIVVDGVEEQKPVTKFSGSKVEGRER